MLVGRDESEGLEVGWGGRGRSRDSPVQHRLLFLSYFALAEMLVYVHRVGSAYVFSPCYSNTQLCKQKHSLL